MTAKRFTITQDFEEHYRQIRDNGHIIMGCFLEAQAEPIVKLLNELHEENQLLKLQVETKLFSRRELEKENEQLKSSDTITDLETEIMKLKTTIQQLRTDNTKQKKKLNTAMKENEQLKKEIENLKQGMIHAAFDKEWK